jgi:hypothetical protein
LTGRITGIFPVGHGSSVQPLAKRYRDLNDGCAISTDHFRPRISANLVIFIDSNGVI